MTIATVLKEKNTNKDVLLTDYNFKNKNIPIGIIKLNSELINSELIDALGILPANFIIKGINKNLTNTSNIKYLDINLDNLGFDFIVSDNIKENINYYLNRGVVPIINKAHYYGTLLNEFNAMKIEGNAFVFDNNSLCDIYYAIIRYIENYKYPYDNKALIKNILAI